MPKLKRLGSDDVISVLKGFGFSVVSQKGSHIKLARQSPLRKQVLTIYSSKEFPKGTTKAIFKQASRFVSEDHLRSFFYTDN